MTHPDDVVAKQHTADLLREAVAQQRVGLAQWLISGYDLGNGFPAHGHGGVKL
jgi:hypothetical protein